MVFFERTATTLELCCIMEMVLCLYTEQILHAKQKFLNSTIFDSIVQKCYEDDILYPSFV